MAFVNSHHVEPLTWARMGNPSQTDHTFPNNKKAKVGVLLGSQSCVIYAVSQITSSGGLEHHALSHHVLKSGIQELGSQAQGFSRGCSRDVG